MDESKQRELEKAVSQLTKHVSKLENANKTCKQESEKSSKIEKELAITRDKLSKNVNATCEKELADTKKKVEEYSDFHAAQKHQITNHTKTNARLEEENKALKKVDHVFGYSSDDAALGLDNEEECGSLKCKTAAVMVKALFEASIFFAATKAKYEEWKVKGAKEQCTLKHFDNGMATPDHIPGYLQLDFAQHRLPSYKIGLKKAVSNHFNYKPGDTIKMPSDEQLYQIITSSTFAFFLQDKGERLALDFSNYMKDYSLLPGYKYEMNTVQYFKTQIALIDNEIDQMNELMCPASELAQSISF
jgi:hypothetical protein